MIKTFTGWHMAAITISFFAVIITVNVALAYYAESSWTGLVVENSYVASQTFNHDAEIAKQQQAIGWQMKVNLKRSAVSVEIHDRSQQPVTGLTVTMILQRPTTDANDSSQVLPETSSGIYAIDRALGAGVWIADVTAEGADRNPVRFVNRVVVD